MARTRLSLFGTVAAAFRGAFNKVTQQVQLGTSPHVDERVAIETRLAAAFTSLPVYWEGTPFNRPATAHVIFRIRPDTGRQISVGRGGLHRYSGTLECRIATPEDGGTAQSRTVADQLSAALGDAKFSFGTSGQITTGVPSYSSQGVVGGWHRATVAVPYRRDKSF